MQRDLRCKLSILSSFLGSYSTETLFDSMHYLALFLLPVALAQNTCGSAAINGLVGYATGTTGGGTGTGTTVTSCSALAAAAAKSGVIRISGILDGCGITDLQSDTTVIGVGTASGKYTTSVHSRSS